MEFNLKYLTIWNQISKGFQSFTRRSTTFKKKPQQVDLINTHDKFAVGEFFCRANDYKAPSNQTRHSWEQEFHSGLDEFTESCRHQAQKKPNQTE